jgi:hypothetical protein
MKTTRWKWMIGGLGLSLGGLAAVAGSPTKNTLLSCQPTTQTVAYRTTETPPVNVPAPKVAEIPTVNFAITPAPMTIPAIPSAAEPTPVVISPYVPIVPTPGPAPVALPQLSQPVVPIPPRLEIPVPAPTVPQVKPLELPRIEQPPVIPVPTMTLPSPSVETRVTAAPGQSNIKFDVPPQGLPKVTPITPSLDYVPIQTEQLKPTPLTTVPATPVSSKPENLLPPVREASSKVSEKKLKVILFMSDERPRFEVRDGDEVYLKVVCNHVEVKSPGENGSNLSTMKASGNVTFTTPGGEGTCADLVVLPGTGSVQVRGNVQFTHNWGKMETTVTGESMTFRLGAVSVQPTPTSGAVPTSYTK